MGSSDVDRLHGVACPDELVPLLRVARQLAHLELADARTPRLTRDRQRFDHAADFEVLEPLHHAGIEQEPCWWSQLVVAPSSARHCGLDRQRQQRIPRADDGIRTRDPHLGKVMLYQLSHVRDEPHSSSRAAGNLAASGGDRPVADAHAPATRSRCHHGTGRCRSSAAATKRPRSARMPAVSRATSGASSLHPTTPTNSVSP